MVPPTLLPARAAIVHLVVEITIWMAYYSDASAIVLFESEVEALRHAVKHTMDVRSVDVPSGDVVTLARSGKA